MRKIVKAVAVTTLAFGMVFSFSFAAKKSNNSPVLCPTSGTVQMATSSGVWTNVMLPSELPLTKENCKNCETNNCAPININNQERCLYSNSIYSSYPPDGVLIYTGN